MEKTSLIRNSILVAVPLAISLGGPAMSSDAAGDALLVENCGACHAATEDGGLARISEVRKTPEGWQMTLERMQRMHGVEFDADVLTDIIRHLSDTRGLAPAEAAPWRYVLEVRPDFVDKVPNEELNVMCGRCHTNARYALQRRSADDWLKHMHMHVGLLTSLEYQASARDREWWNIATSRTYAELAEAFPLESDAWNDWKAAQWPSLAGEWRVIGKRPGKGGYQGTMIVAASDSGYEVAYTLATDDGDAITGSSRSVVYTGHEWRGSGQLNGRNTYEVYGMSVDGSELNGRWFYEGKSEDGGDFRAVRMDGAAPQILGLSPSRIGTGQSGIYRINGIGLSGAVDLGPGLTWVTEESDGTSLVGRIEAAPDAATGARTVTVGDTSLARALAVYDKVDYVRVSPEYTIARLGGGATPAVDAQFEATGYLAGPDGEIGTADDVSLGLMEAEWSVEPFDEEAERMRDVDYAGKMMPDGRFVPSGAGPNPDRKYSTNNAGNLVVVAKVMDGETELEGRAHLIVTVQRWVDPPIR